MLQEQRKRSFGYGETQSNCFPLNFKRPKVDAVRDFPRDCGTFSPGATTSSSKVVSSDAASLVSKVQIVDATRKLPMDCGSLRTRVATGSRKTADSEASFQESKAQRLDEIHEFSRDCGSFPTKVAGRPRMSRVGQVEVLVPERTLEVISPISDNKLKRLELVLSREEANPVHQDDDGNVLLKILDKPELDNEPDEKLALVDANKASASVKAFLRPQPPARLYPAPKIREGFSVVRDFPPGCGGLTSASRSKDEMEDCVSKDNEGQVKGEQAQVQRSSDLKLVLGRDDRHSLSPSEEKVALNSAPQVAGSKFEEDADKKNCDDMDAEDGTGIQVRGYCGLEVVPGIVDSRAPFLSQKKRSPNSVPQVVNTEMEENLVGKREKKQLAIEGLKSNYRKQTSFTASTEDAGRVGDDKERHDHCDSLRVSNNCPSDCKNNTSNRYNVREALNQFRMIFENISEEPEPKLKDNMKTVGNVHVEAAIVLKKQQRWVNTTKLLGPVPGIEETGNMSKVSKVSKVHSVVDDISQGKEKIPIRLINNLDDEKPLPFHYITKLLCLRPRDRSLPIGCDCTDGCSEMKSCLCIQKNGGEIPFTDSGAIIMEKPLVYECGPSCKCPPSCKNRVSQHGIRYQLEVFKTRSVGWGVRSRNYISVGSFICEYVGELLRDKEAELRRYDDYLFDVGCDRENLDVSSDHGYTIDAAHCGNVGRFLNHSCSPNVYAQNVLYDHHNKQFPHIMFFAAKNIPPLRELTFDYNYKIDTVRDEDGNIKKKNCYCGSTECRERMY